MIIDLPVRPAGNDITNVLHGQEVMRETQIDTADLIETRQPLIIESHIERTQVILPMSTR